MVKKTDTVFSKDQFLNSTKYAKYKDFVKWNLKDNVKYTKAQVDKMIQNFYGKVKGE